MSPGIIVPPSKMHPRGTWPAGTWFPITQSPPQPDWQCWGAFRGETDTATGSTGFIGKVATDYVRKVVGVRPEEKLGTNSRPRMAEGLIPTVRG